MIEVVVKRNPNKFEKICGFCKSELRMSNSDLRINVLTKSIVFICPVCRNINLFDNGVNLKITKKLDPNFQNVHTSHCCILHGCKYRDEDCAVVSMLAIQQHDCEECSYTER